MINTVNRLEILNLDEMAVQQEEEEKQLEEDYDEEDEDEEEVIINHEKLDDNPPLNKPLFTPNQSSAIKSELPNSARINLFSHDENYDNETQSSRHEKDENKEQEELARKIQEQLADEWNDSFLNEKPFPSQPVIDQDPTVEDTKSVHSSIAESALTTLEEVKSTSETIPNLPNITEVPANSPLQPITSKPKRPSIFGKLNPKETSSNSSNSPIPPVIEPANLAALAADLPPSALENQDDPTSKKKKQKQGSKTSKKKKPKQKKKSLDFFGTSSFLKNQEDDEEQEALTTTNTTNDKPVDTSDNPNAVGGFGLTALWDDGSAGVDDYVTNDDFHIPLPPPSSSMHSHHDIEAANESSSNHDEGSSNTSIFNNFFGTTTSSTATSSALNTIQLSNEFLSNLSKKAVTSFFDNIETEIDLEEDPILKQVEWNKRNPHAIRSLQDQQNNTFSYLNFFPTTSNTSTDNTIMMSSSSSSSSSFPSSSTQMMDHQSSSSTPFTSPSIASQYSSLLKEAMSSFSGVLHEMRETIFPFSSLNLGKLLQILWKIIQLALLLLYYTSMILLFIPLQRIVVVIFGPRLLQSFSCSQVRVRIFRGVILMCFCLCDDRSSYSL